MLVKDFFNLIDTSRNVEISLWLYDSTGKKLYTSRHYFEITAEWGSFYNSGPDISEYYNYKIVSICPSMGNAFTLCITE